MNNTRKLADTFQQPLSMEFIASNSKLLPANQVNQVVDMVDTAAFDARKKDAERARTLLLAIRLQLAGKPL